MTAEQQYREAFERLKKNVPIRLARGTPVTQNNVARESGVDPSALRKSRFPSLIAEIQRYLIITPVADEPSKRQKILARRNGNRTLKEQLESVTRQRDTLACQLLEADSTILDLRDRLAAVEKIEGPSNVHTFPSKVT